MTVYIDDMYKYPMGRFRNMRMSHMIADTDEELHNMAAQIGIVRRWFQGDHYDICMSKRGLAISKGAKPITIRELGEIIINKRKLENEQKATQDNVNPTADYPAMKRRATNPGLPFFAPGGVLINSIPQPIYSRFAVSSGYKDNDIKKSDFKDHNKKYPGAKQKELRRERGVGNVRKFNYNKFIEALIAA